jgi:hypothetical protein
MILSGLRFYWITSKGYRLRPWKSPYLSWRMETFFGCHAETLDAHTFFRLLWKERVRMASFLRWADERRREQRRRSQIN